MHELSIAHNIVAIVQQHMGEPARPVLTVTLRIGAFAGVVPESLEFSFRAIVESTPLAGTELVIESVPATIHCRVCEARSVLDQPVFVCPQCGSTETDLLSGMELDVVQIELDDERAEV